MLDASGLQNPFADGNSGAAITIDFSQYRNHTLTLTAACTLTFTAPAQGTNITIVLTQDGTGGRVVTFPGTVKDAPSVDLTASASTQLEFYYDGTSYWLVSSSLNSLYNDGNSGAAITLNFAATRMHKVTLTAATTLTFVAPPAGSVVGIEFTQSGAGSFSITWPATMSSGVASQNSGPQAQANATGISLVLMFYDGTSYWVIPTGGTRNVINYDETGSFPPGGSHAMLFLNNLNAAGENEVAYSIQGDAKYYLHVSTTGAFNVMKVGLPFVIQDLNGTEGLRINANSATVHNLNSTPISDGNSGAAKTIDWKDQNHTVTMTAACTFTFTAPPTGTMLTLRVVQDGTGGWVPTWPAAVKDSPQVDLTLSSTTELIFYYDGTSYWLVGNSQVPVQNDGNSGAGPVTLDFALNRQHRIAINTATLTLVFTAPPSGSTIFLRLVQDGTGGRLVTWPGTVKWPSGVAPVLSVPASAVDVLTFLYDGTNYYMLAFQGGMA